MKTRTAVVLGMGFMLASGVTLAQQMYKWKDDQGVVHYSDTPPPPPIHRPRATGCDPGASQGSG